jgi:cell wall-associated NlpC family hydrolase
MREAFVSAARSLLGTPYHAHARLPGVGVDCIGVPIVACWLSGLKPRTWDVQGYSMRPDGTLLERCAEHMVRVSRADMRPGDIAVVRWGADPHHVGVVAALKGRRTIIHAENFRHRKVMEHALVLGDSAMQFVAAYRLPELA